MAERGERGWAIRSEDLTVNATPLTEDNYYLVTVHHRPAARTGVGVAPSKLHAQEVAMQNLRYQLQAPEFREPAQSPTQPEGREGARGDGELMIREDKAWTVIDADDGWVALEGPYGESTPYAGTRLYEALPAPPEGREQALARADGQRNALLGIIRNDKTPTYAYGEPRPDGAIPEAGQRWNCPREIARDLLDALSTRDQGVRGSTEGEA